jgi:hypothetical protein
VKAEVVAPKRNWLSDVKRDAEQLPARVIIHAVEKFGKSSLAAFAPKVLFGMTHDETGLLTLIAEGRVPKTDYFPPWETWTDTRESIESLRDTDHGFKTLALDTLNSLAALCAAYVCKKHFNNDWGPNGFQAYGKGIDTCVSEWTSFLVLLDQVRAAKKMGIIALCHTKVKAFNNPLGPNYDRYIPDMPEKLWGLSHKWADAIMFGNFETEVKVDGNAKKGKGTGGQRRILYTENTAAYNAGTRYGLPGQICLGNSGEEAWGNFQAAMKDAREQTKGEE